MSIVHGEVTNSKGYTPRCGSISCHDGCPITQFNGKQFVCPSCGWVSHLHKDFIQQYKKVQGIL